MEQVTGLDNGCTSLALDAAGNPVILYATFAGEIKVQRCRVSRVALPTAGSRSAATYTVGVDKPSNQAGSRCHPKHCPMAVDARTIRKIIDRGDSLKHDGKLGRAIAAYSWAIRLAPALAEAHYKRGTVRLAKGDLPRAILDFTEAIRLRPEYARAYYRRGLANRGTTTSTRQSRISATPF